MDGADRREPVRARARACAATGRGADAALDASVAHALSFAGQRLAATDAALPATAYPHLTTPAGAWVTTDASYWTSGFLSGAEWLMYETTREARWLL
jgi:hypothetical protein